MDCVYMCNGPMGGYPAMALTAFGDKSAVGIDRGYRCLVLTTVRTDAVCKNQNHIKTSPPIEYLTIDPTKR